MKLVIFRHGPAGNREEWEAEGRDDRERPLTPKGKKEVRKAVAGLALLVPQLDLLVTSPLIRAAQTAKILAREYGSALESLEALAPEHDPDEMLPWLEAHDSAGTVAVVGHEPHLSTLTCYLLSGTKSSFLELKKGGACLLDLPQPSGPGSAVLEWLLPDRELRRLGE